MSKKLIAVASAAALALSVLVGVAPASANATVTFTGNNAGASTSGPGTAAAPMRQNVPDQNTLASADSATMAFASLLPGDKITVTTSGKVRIVTTQTAGDASVDVTKLGTQSYERTLASDFSGSTLSLFVSVTDTTTTEIKWSVARTAGSASGSLYIRGVAGLAYGITDIVAPTTLAQGASFEVRFKLRDVFGNQLDTATIPGAVSGAANTVAAAYDAPNAWHDATITSSTNRVFILTIDGFDGSVSEIAGFPDETSTSVIAVNSAATATANAAATAQIAALTAQLANSRGKDVSVTKKKYNNLARKWNRAFPSQAVKLK